MAAPTTASAGAFPYGPPVEATARFCPWCYRDGQGTCSVQAHWPAIRSHSPIYLSGVECAATRAIEAAGVDVGLMLRPGSGLAGHAPAYRWWAADNGCFAQGAGFDPWAWFAWLTSLPDVGRRRRCLFAVAPDVLGDAEATWERSWPWLALVRAVGIPVAVVAQNGADAHAPLPALALRWGSGSSRRRRRRAQRRRTAAGSGVHMGRVNSWRRLELAAGWNVDSVDGTYLAFSPDANGRRLARWLRRLSTRDGPLS